MPSHLSGTIVTHCYDYGEGSKFVSPVRRGSGRSGAGAWSGAMSVISELERARDGHPWRRGTPEIIEIEVPIDRPVEKIVEIPVETVVEKIVEVPVDRIVEKVVTVEKIVEVPVDRVVEKVITKEKIVEVPVEKVVTVERIVEVPVERVVTVEKIKEVPVDRIVEKVVTVEVPVEKVVPKFVEVPKIVEKVVEVEKIVEVPVERIIEKIVKVPIEQPRELHSPPRPPEDHEEVLALREALRRRTEEVLTLQRVLSEAQAALTAKDRKIHQLEDVRQTLALELHKQIKISHLTNSAQLLKQQVENTYAPRVTSPIR